MKLTKKLLREYREKAIKAGACEEAIEAIDLVLAGKMTIKEFKGLEDLPGWCYWYAENVIWGPWPDAEDIIRTDPWAAYRYALCLLKRPWPEAEDVIRTAPLYAYYYALEILKGPWPEGEDIIRTAPLYAYYYALCLLKLSPTDAKEWAGIRPTLTTTASTTKEDESR